MTGQWAFILKIALSFIVFILELCLLCSLFAFHNAIVLLTRLHTMLLLSDSTPSINIPLPLDIYPSSSHPHSSHSHLHSAKTNFFKGSLHFPLLLSTAKPKNLNLQRTFPQVTHLQIRQHV